MPLLLSVCPIQNVVIASGGCTARLPACAIRSCVLGKRLLTRRARKLVSMSAMGMAVSVRWSWCWRWGSLWSSWSLRVSFRGITARILARSRNMYSWSQSLRSAAQVELLQAYPQLRGVRLEQIIVCIRWVNLYLCINSCSRERDKQC